MASFLVSGTHPSARTIRRQWGKAVKRRLRFDATAFNVTASSLASAASRDAADDAVTGMCEATRLYFGIGKGLSSAKRLRMFVVSLAMLLSKPLIGSEPAKAIEPVENTARVLPSRVGFRGGIVVGA
jgi:hypothetical protein